MITVTSEGISPFGSLVLEWHKINWCPPNYYKMEYNKVRIAEKHCYLKACQWLAFLLQHFLLTSGEN